MSKEKWPKGLSMAVAKLCLEPEQLTAQFGIQFFEDQDDLDEFRAALLRVDERYECGSSPSPSASGDTVVGAFGSGGGGFSAGFVVGT